MVFWTKNSFIGFSFCFFFLFHLIEKILCHLFMLFVTYIVSMLIEYIHNAFNRSDSLLCLSHLLIIFTHALSSTLLPFYVRILCCHEMKPQRYINLLISFSRERIPHPNSKIMILKSYIATSFLYCYVTFIFFFF